MSTVLIVDDDKNICKFIRKLLENNGFIVLEANNGVQCLEIMHKNSVPTVIIDIVMPEKDGISTIKEIRRFYSDTKVIAVSGGAVFTPEVYLDEAKIVGADFELKKPIDREALLSCIGNG